MRVTARALVALLVASVFGLVASDNAASCAAGGASLYSSASTTMHPPTDERHALTFAAPPHPLLPLLLR